MQWHEKALTGRAERKKQEKIKDCGVRSKDLRNMYACVLGGGVDVRIVI